MANLPNNSLLSNISPSGAQPADSQCFAETACRQRGARGLGKGLMVSEMGAIFVISEFVLMLLGLTLCGVAVN
jgi:hypothetical protein